MITQEEREQLKRELLEEINAEKLAEQARIERIRLEEEEKLREELQLREKFRKERKARLEANEEPLVELVGSVDTEHGTKIELDWNQAFINHLIANGYSGPTDEIIVQRWLELISKEVVTDIIEHDDDGDYDHKIFR